MFIHVAILLFHSFIFLLIFFMVFAIKPNTFQLLYKCLVLPKPTAETEPFDHVSGLPQGLHPLGHASYNYIKSFCGGISKEEPTVMVGASYRDKVGPILGQSSHLIMEVKLRNPKKDFHFTCLSNLILLVTTHNWWPQIYCRSTQLIQHPVTHE